MSRILRSRTAAQTFEQPAKRTKTQDAPAASPKAAKKLQVGDAIPNVELPDQDGNDVKLGDIKGLLVLFAYPRASTPGCTRQTRGFGSDYAEFERHGAKVFGISADSEKAQTTFKTKLELPFNLLSDPKYELLGPLGAKKHPKGVVRSHWVFNDGELVFAENGVKPDTSPERTLKAVVEQVGTKSNGASKKAEPVEAEEPTEKAEEPEQEPEEEGKEEAKDEPKEETKEEPKEEAKEEEVTKEEEGPKEATKEEPAEEAKESDAKPAETNTEELAIEDEKPEAAADASEPKTDAE